MNGLGVERCADRQVATARAGEQSAAGTLQLDVPIVGSGRRPRQRDRRRMTRRPGFDHQAGRVLDVDGLRRAPRVRRIDEWVE